MGAEFLNTIETNFSLQKFKESECLQAGNVQRLMFVNKVALINQETSNVVTGRMLRCLHFETKCQQHLL